MCYSFNIFILRAVFGKASGQLLRIMGVVHVIEEAAKFINKLDDSLLDDDILFIEKLMTIKSFDRIISKDTVQSSIILLEYFLNHKLFLAGYLSIDARTINETIINEKQLAPEEEKTKKETSNWELEKFILLHPGSVIFLSNISEKKQGNKVSFAKACKNLQNDGFGKYGNVKQTTSRKQSLGFLKTDLKILDQEKQLKFINNLVKYSVTVNSYNQNYFPIIQVSFSEINEDITALNIDESNNLIKFNIFYS